MKKALLNMAISIGLLTIAAQGVAASLPISGFSAPVGLLELAEGSLLVAEWSGDCVTKVTGPHKEQVAAGISSPAGLAMDDEGNIYIAGYGDGNVYIWREGSRPKVFASGFKQPTGLLWSKNKTLLVANRGAGAIESIDKNGQRRVISSGHNLPVGIAETPSGNMYVSCYGGTLDRVSGDGSIQKIKNGLITPGVGVIPAGNDSVFVVDNGAGKVVEAGPSGVTRTLAQNLSSPVGLAKTTNNEIIAATWGDGKIQIVGIINE